MVDTKKVKEFVEQQWPDIESTLSDFIRIPNQSPMFDPEWETNGHMDDAVKLLCGWVEKQNIEGLKMEVIKAEKRTPLIFIEIEGTGPGTTMMYGHLDCQPPLTESWSEGLGPYTPVVKDGFLYGRGGADDGYALFGSLSSLMALKAAGTAHPRAVILIEASEESGSPDLPFYIEQLKDRIGTPELIVCLDSGCGDYERLWVTTSLRGMVAGTLSVSVLEEGCHSGLSSGIVPSSFRILRSLIDRIEDAETGEIKVPELSCEIPEGRVAEAKVSAEILGDTVYSEFPWSGETGPTSKDLSELLLRRTWKSALSVTGVDGMPPLAAAGNVLRTHTSVKLSMRLPPCVDGATAAKALEKVLSEDIPYGAKASFKAEKNATGWNAPIAKPWLADALKGASKEFFGAEVASIGEGGSIPFLGLLSEMFPEACFVVTGVLGPKSNAHGPNEKMCIDMVKKIICSVAVILDAQSKGIASSN